MVTPAFSAAARMAATTAPMPPCGSDLRAGRSADLAGQAIVEAEQRGRRARAEMAAERRVEGEQALQPVVRKLLVEHVGDIHQQHAQEVAHVLLAEPLQRQAGLAEGSGLEQRHAAEIGRRGGRGSGFRMPA